MKKTGHFKAQGYIILGLAMVLLTLFSVNFVSSADVYDAHGQTLSANSEDVIRLAGVWFFANKDTIIKEITIYSAMNPNYCVLGNETGILQVGSTPSNDNSTFNYNLKAGQKYFVACNGSVNWGRNNTGCGGVSTGTINKTNLNYTEGYLGGSTSCSGRANTYNWVINIEGIRTGDDTTTPSVVINYPANASYYPQTIIVNVTATDTPGVSSCKYSVNNWVTNYSMTQSGNLWTRSDSNLTYGSYLLRVSCNDTLGNVNDSETRSFTIKNIVTNSVTYSSSVVGDSNQSFILNFTYDSSVYDIVTAIINYNGVNYTSSMTYPSSNFSYCYQESANVSNQTGKDVCSGLIYTGGYGGQVGYTTMNSSAYDGNYETYTSPIQSILYINYTLPSGVNNIIFHKNDIVEPANYTIPNDCLEYSVLTGILQLQVFIHNGDHLYYYCKNDTAWDTFIEVDGNKFYEEGIYLSINSNTTQATNYVIVPNPSTNTNYTFFWYLTQTNITGSYLTNTSLYTQLVTTQPSINITTYPCASPQFEALNFSWANQEDLTAMTDMIITYNFKYGITNTSSIQSYGAITNNTLRICIPNATNNYQIGYAEISYYKDTYETLKYYLFTNYTLSNVTTDQQILYSLPSNESTSFLVTIKDKGLNPYTNKLIVLLRWYPSINSYKIVEMSKTDQNGQAPIHVHVEDIDYRVAIYELNGTLINLQSPVRMLCLVNPCSYDISLQDTGNDYFYIYNIQSNLSWNNSTKTFTYIWNDPSQYVTMMSLVVTKENGFSSSIICNTSSASYIGVLTCNVGNNTGLIKATAYKTASPETIFDELIIRIGSIISNQVGLFFSFVLALVGALIGIFSPVGAILFMLVGLLFSLFIGSISLTFFIGIGSLGGIVFYFIRKAQRIS